MMAIMQRDYMSLGLLKVLTGTEYWERCASITASIGKNLTSTVKVKGNLFTSHGFDHCVRVIEQLDTLLSPGNDLNSIEVFLLCSAALIHDLVMTSAPDMRFVHSEEVKKFIMEEHEKLGDSPMGRISRFWSDNEAAIVAQVAFAHSDVKDEEGKVIQKTLEQVAHIKDSQIKGERVRTSVLAALLRFGDELDCTSARIDECQAIHAAEQIRESVHWRRCSLFRELLPPDHPYDTVMFRINEGPLGQSNDQENDFQRIEEVKSKLSLALNEVNELVLFKRKIDWWRYRTVEIEKLENASVQSRYDKWLEIYLVEAEMAPLDQPVSTTASPRVIDKAISDRIREWVEEDGLLLDGHFELDGKRHTRDWIDTAAILHNQAHLSEIVEAFSGLMAREALKPEEHVLVGEGFPGLVIASALGFRAGAPATYIVRKTNEAARPKHEKVTKIDELLKVVLVTDAISNGSTAKDTITILENLGVARSRVVALFSVLRRGEGNGALISEVNGVKVYSLCDEFPLTLCSGDVENCIQRKFGNVTIVKQS